MTKETAAFSSIKRMFGEYTSSIRFQKGKRDDNEDRYTTCLEELHQMDGNNLSKTSYATEHTKSKNYG